MKIQCLHQIYSKELAVRVRGEFAVNVFSDELIVRWDEERQCLLIINPSVNVANGELVKVHAETFQKMSFGEASEFIGSRLALLIPALRQRYVDAITGQVQ